MKTLFLIRHSKAVMREADLPDIQRTLVKTGEKKTVVMARKLKKKGVKPDLMISSTASRALETALLFAKSMGYPKKKIEVKDALYHEMNPEALLDIVRQAENKYTSIMLFGHNPAFTDFASYLVSGFAEDIPKTGIVGIQFEKDSWKDIAQGGGKLGIFEYPKRLSKTFKRLEMELQNEIALNVQEVLDKMDLKCAKKMKKAVNRTSDRMAKDFLKILKVEKIKEEKRALAAAKAKKKKPRPKTKQTAKTEPKAKPKPEPEPETKPQSKPAAIPKTKAVPKSKAKPQPKPRPRTKPAPKPGPKTEPASKPKAKATPMSKPSALKTTRAKTPQRTRQAAVKKQVPNPGVSRTRKTTPGAKEGTPGTKK